MTPPQDPPEVQVEVPPKRLAWFSDLHVGDSRQLVLVCCFKLEFARQKH